MMAVELVFGFRLGVRRGHVQKMSNAWVTKMTRIDSPPIATGKIKFMRVEVIPAGFPAVISQIRGL